MRVGLPALLALILAGCGELATPVGDVTGRVLGVSTAGTLHPYAYPLGRPDLKVDLVVTNPDAYGPGTGDGEYDLEGVPTSVSAIVVYDGSDRAELIPVEPAGGTVNRVADRFGAASPVGDLQKMPLAGTVLAAAVPDGGATPWQPTFELRSTVHAGLVPSAGGAYTVWPLPSGSFALSATLPGFVAAGAPVTVMGGATVAAPVTLLVDAGATAPGCGAVSAAAPSQCENGLVCEPADGRCYQCTADDASKCTSAGCDVATHLCNPPTPSASRFCSPCSASVQCTSGMVCRYTSVTSGYCTTDKCLYDSDCPAGFECSDSQICRPPEGCDAWIQTMGAVCYSNSRCEDGLGGGWCHGDSDDQPGVCTASCADQRDCEVGTATTFVCQLGRCVKTAAP